MITRKYKKICWLSIPFLIAILFLAFFSSLNHTKTLQGSHLFQNIIGDGEYTLYVTPTTTGPCTFQVYDFNNNIIYEVYDTRNNKLISEGRVAYTSEGYRPFMQMSLKNNITYAVTIKLLDKNTFDVAHIELCE